MILCVTGGRHFPDRDMVWRQLDRVHAHRPITCLVHGACPTGADRHADDWAEARGVPVKRYPADWLNLEIGGGANLKRWSDGTIYNPAAGPARNTAMANSGLDGCIAFPGGWGTADTVIKCLAAGVKVMQVKA